MAALIALLLLALLPRLLVPAGYMPMVEQGRVLMLPCPGATAMAMPGGRHHHGEEDKAGPSPCPFAALASPATGGAPPAVLAAAILFALALALLRPPPRRVAPPARLRPPLRAPPR